LEKDRGIRYIRGRQQKEPSTHFSKAIVLDYASSPPLYVTKTTPLLRLFETMVARGFRRIFVATPSSVLEGVVTPMEVVHYLFWKSREGLEEPVLNILLTQVSKIMRRDVVSINQSADMTESVRLMRQKGVNGLAVVDGNGLLKAVLTVRDVLERFNPPLKESSIEKYMSKSPVCISVDRTLREGIETMVGSGYRRLPCLEGSKPLGLFSSRSVVRFLGGKEFIRQALKPLNELMSMSVLNFIVKDLPTLEPEVSVSEAWEAVKRSSYGSALVVSSSSLEGFMTEMDFLKAVEV
jgi:CBS domain-containing protein